MEKYLLNMPKELKNTLMKTAKNEGYSLNAQILFILWEWVNKTKNKED